MSNWECAYCGHKQLQSTENSHEMDVILQVGETDLGHLGLHVEAKRCLNTDCNKITISQGIGNFALQYAGRIDRITEYHHIWHLLPSSNAKPQPDYIPVPIRQDYYEACKIANDSPKASATLARRCLQGMIRDFCGIHKATLYKEIQELEKQLADGTAPKGVDDETIEAITAVRKLGNIGAHMETDINIIVDVDVDEAQSLIELIEMLFAEWYVARHTRQQRLAKLQASTAEKERQKQAAPTTSAQPAIAALGQEA